MGISALGPSALHVLLAVAGVLCAAQIGTAAASRPSESDLDDPIDSDRYWIPPLDSNDIKCGGTSIKTGDGGEYRCFTHGEGICRDNDLGSFGPGQWTLGIVERNLTLYTPSNQISWQFCSDVTHLCIGEDHGTDGGQWYSQERPYLFFYDEKTNTYVGELTCDDTDGDDGDNIGKPTLLKMVDLSYTGQYVDYGEDGVSITKFKKGQTEDPFDNNALMELRVQRDGIGDFFYDPFKCYWTQECSNCGDEQYEEYEFDLDFELNTFCAAKIPLTDDVKSQMEAVLRKYLNQDAECVDLEAGVIGCVDEVYFDIDVFEFENSNETCGTIGGTDDRRLLWEDDRGNIEPLDGRPGLIRGANLPFQGDGSHRLLQQRRRSRRSRGRAKGRGRCRRCRRRDSNSRKLRATRGFLTPDSSGEGEPLRRSLQQDELIPLDECPVDVAKLFREQNETLFENVTESDVYNFTYLDSLSPSSQPSSSPMPSAVPSAGDVSSNAPSVVLSSEPSTDPSSSPSAGPSLDPSSQPSVVPSGVPSSGPSSKPSSSPSTMPSSSPSLDPSTKPSIALSGAPSDIPSSEPTSQPSMVCDTCTAAQFCDCTGEIEEGCMCVDCGGKCQCGNPVDECYCDNIDEFGDEYCCGELGEGCPPSPSPTPTLDPCDACCDNLIDGMVCLDRSSCLCISNPNDGVICTCSGFVEKPNELL